VSGGSNSSGFQTREREKKVEVMMPTGGTHLAARERERERERGRERKAGLGCSWPALGPGCGPVGLGTSLFFSFCSDIFFFFHKSFITFA
jgi:hypothetical protein